MVAYYGWLNRYRHREVFEKEDIYPARQPLPAGLSTWKPLKLTLSHFSIDIPRSVSEDGKVELIAPRSIGASLETKKVWDKGAVKSIPEDQMLSVTGDLIEEPPRKVVDERGLPSDRYMFYSNSIFRFESSDFAQMIHVIDDKTKRSRAFTIPYVNPSDRTEGRFHISPYDDFTFLETAKDLYSIRRCIDLAEPKMIASGSFAQSVSIVDTLPSNLKPGSHLIIRVDGAESVISNGEKWNLSVPFGFLAAPRTFVSPDVVVGRLVKNSKDGLLKTATIAFWKRDGQVCTLEDALPDRTKEINRLLSSFEGFNRGSRFVSNYFGTVAVSLNNFGDRFDYSTASSKASLSRSGTIILNIKP